MSKNKIIIGGLLALIVLGIGFWLMQPHQPSQNLQSGAPLGGVGSGGTLSPNGTYVYPNPTNLDYLRANALEAVQLLNLGGGSLTTGIQMLPTIGSSCNTGTSTLFAVQNPFAATSTAQLVRMQVGGNATTSSLLVGTSTGSGPSSSASVSASLVSSTNGIATGTTQWAASGNLSYSGNGFINGAATNEFILVKPTEWVVAFSTSTATGAGAAGYSPTESTCNYKLLWEAL